MNRMELYTLLTVKCAMILFDGEINTSVPKGSFVIYMKYLKGITKNWILGTEIIIS